MVLQKRGSKTQRRTGYHLPTPTPWSSIVMSRLQVDAKTLGGRAGVESAQGPRTGISQGPNLDKCLGMTVGWDSGWQGGRTDRPSREANSYLTQDTITLRSLALPLPAYAGMGEILVAFPVEGRSGWKL